MAGSRSTPAVEPQRDLRGRDAVEQHVADRDLDVLGVDAERERQAGLGVEVDEEHPEALVGERRSEGDDRRRLGDPTLLVGDGDDAAHGVLRSSRRVVGWGAGLHLRA